MRHRFHVGSRCIVSLEEPLPNLEPVGLRAQVKMRQPNVEHPGNLTVLIERPEGHPWNPKVAVKPSLEMFSESSYRVWLYPKTTDVAAKRLVSCASKIALAEGKNFDSIRRLLLGRDFRAEDGHNVFHSADPKLTKRIHEVKKTLNPLQRAALRHVMGAKHPFALIHGSESSEKSYLAAVMARVANTKGMTTVCCAASNDSVETLLEMIVAQDPTLRPLRYHSTYLELEGLCEEKTNISKTGPSGTTRSTLTTKAWMNSLGIEMPPEEMAWTASKTHRPNFKKMGLHIRALESVGVMHDSKVATMKPEMEASPSHRSFINDFYNKNLHLKEDTSKQDGLPFRSKAIELFKTTVRSHKIVGCTLNMLGDSLLNQNCHPELAIIDDGGQANELETLMAFIHNHETIKLIVIIGDYKDTQPLVISRGMSTNGKPVNPFAEQLRQSLLRRLALSNFPVFALTKDEHRGAAARARYEDLGRDDKDGRKPKIETRECGRCHEVGHLESSCPQNPDNCCVRCGQLGHRAKYCVGPDTRTCTLCNEVGHVRSRCPRWMVRQGGA